MNRSGKLHALLSTARVANIPSVVSNVWLGIALGTMLKTSAISATYKLTVPWFSVCLLMAAGICLYVAGNFLNDWMDREWDAKNRPERALPRKLFTPLLYRNLALSLAIAGLTLAAIVNWAGALTALLITVSIVIYTVWHKRAAWAVMPMGLCRGLLPIMGALGTEKTPDYAGNILFTAVWAGIGGGALFCYIVGLSASARRESMAQPTQNASKLPRFLFIASAGLLMLPSLPFIVAEYSIYPFIGLVPYAIWLILCHSVHRRPIPRYVSALLAGIPLLDWVYLLPFSVMIFLQTSSPSPLGVASLIIPPLAFISALLLQRLAPAT